MVVLPNFKAENNLADIVRSRDNKAYNSTVNLKEVLSSVIENNVNSKTTVGQAVNQIMIRK